LYAGTGAVGIEALSRGARVVTFVESDPNAVQIMRKNLTACRLLEHAELCLNSTERFLRTARSSSGPYDVVFADPPYADRAAIGLVLESWAGGLLAADAVLVIEQQARVDAPAATDHAQLIRRYAYGDTALLLYGPAPDRSVP
jgi:16S rRNA (guanine966-N2)-methyltransferase